MRILILLLSLILSVQLNAAENKEPAKRTDLEINDLTIVMSIVSEIELKKQGVVEKATGNDIVPMFTEEASKETIPTATDNYTTKKYYGRRMTIRRIKNLHIIYHQARTLGRMCWDTLNNLDQIQAGQRDTHAALYDSTVLDRFLNLYLYKATQKDEDAKGFMTWQMRRYLFLNVDIENSQNFSCQNNLKPILPVSKRTSIENNDILARKLVDQGELVADESLYINPCEEIQRFGQCLTQLDAIDNRRILEEHSRLGHDNLPEYDDHNLHYPGQDREK